MGYRINTIWNPAMFQGQTKKRHYFEGWYYKLVNREENRICAIIPGVSITGERESAHAFIQIIDGLSCKTRYFAFDMDRFHYSKKDFEISIGDNVFSREKIQLNIHQDEAEIKGSLQFRDLKPWPVTAFSPGCMGWFAFAPFMECYHGILSMNHDLSGSLLMDGSMIDFDGGLGYMEKDWGRSFPKAWIWTQSNHFDGEKASLILSIAEIPWLGKHFTGFIAGFWYKNQLYRFATYTGAVLESVEYGDALIKACISDRQYKLEVAIEKADTGVLSAPRDGIMNEKVGESIQAALEVLFYKKAKEGSQLIYRGKGRNAGLEIVGKLE